MPLELLALTTILLLGLVVALGARLCLSPQKEAAYARFDDDDHDDHAEIESGDVARAPNGRDGGRERPGGGVSGSGASMHGDDDLESGYGARESGGGEVDSSASGSGDVGGISGGGTDGSRRSVSTRDADAQTTISGEQSAASLCPNDPRLTTVVVLETEEVEVAEAEATEVGSVVASMIANEQFHQPCSHNIPATFVGTKATANYFAAASPLSSGPSTPRMSYGWMSDAALSPLFLEAQGATGTDDTKDAIAAATDPAVAAALALLTVERQFLEAQRALLDADAHATALLAEAEALRGVREGRNATAPPVDEVTAAIEAAVAAAALERDDALAAAEEARVAAVATVEETMAMRLAAAEAAHAVALQEAKMQAVMGVELEAACTDTASLTSPNATSITSSGEQRNGLACSASACSAKSCASRASSSASELSSAWSSGTGCSSSSRLDTDEARLKWARAQLVAASSAAHLKQAQELLAQLIDEQMALREAEDELRGVLDSQSEGSGSEWGVGSGEGGRRGVPSGEAEGDAARMLFSDDDGSPASSDGQVGPHTPYSRLGFAKDVYEGFAMPGAADGPPHAFLDLSCDSPDVAEGCPGEGEIEIVSPSAPSDGAASKPVSFTPKAVSFTSPGLITGWRTVATPAVPANASDAAASPPPPPPESEWRDVSTPWREVATPGYTAELKSEVRRRSAVVHTLQSALLAKLAKPTQQANKKKERRKSELSKRKSSQRASLEVGAAGDATSVDEDALNPDAPSAYSPLDPEQIAAHAAARRKLLAAHAQSAKAIDSHGPYPAAAALSPAPAPVQSPAVSAPASSPRSRLARPSPMTHPRASALQWLGFAETAVPSSPRSAHCKGTPPATAEMSLAAEPLVLPGSVVAAGGTKHTSGGVAARVLRASVGGQGVGRSHVASPAASKANVAAREAERENVNASNVASRL